MGDHFSQPLIDYIDVTRPDFGWTPEHRETICFGVLTLAGELTRIAVSLQSARDAHDMQVVRQLTISGLAAICQSLLPLVGPERVWPLNEAVDAFSCAVNGKRHWLTALPVDEVHVNRQCPKRTIIQTYVAAALDHFGRTSLGKTQAAIAQELAGAMENGGFWILHKEQPTPPSARTIQDWRNLHAKGKRAGRRQLSDIERQLFSSHLGSLSKGSSGRAPAEHLQATLGEVSTLCRMWQEIPPSFCKLEKQSRPQSCGSKSRTAR